MSKRSGEQIYDLLIPLCFWLKNSSALLNEGMISLNFQRFINGFKR
ncbi:hypothetical protein RintRC_6889 [Richelia intracellularis]|nr:hypothetical protein RintRC_6889 [Richelia intracellularis]